MSQKGQVKRRPGKVFPLIGSHRYQCQDISDASFRSYMRERAPDFHVHETCPTNEEPDIAYEMVHRLIDEESELIGIFVNGGGISGVLRAMREFDVVRRKDIRIVCRDIGLEAQKGLVEGLITAALPHSLKKMPEELIDVMLDRIERREQASIQQRIVPFDIVTPESVWA
jgi:LacI family transcriptional regulator